MISSQIAFPFGDKPNVEDIEQTRTVVIDPQPGWNHGQMIKFVVPRRGVEYLSSVLMLEASFSVQKPDGSDLTPLDIAAFVNLPIASFFQSARLKLGQTIIEGMNANWEYRTLMSSILSLDVFAKGAYASDMYKWIPDAPYKSQSRVHAQNPDLPVEVQLIEAPDSTRILQGTNTTALKIVFQHIRLRVNYLTLSPTREASLWTSNALRYPYYALELENVYTVPAGVQNITIQVARGQIPQLFFFGFIETSDTQQDYTVNWQNFDASQVRSIQAECNGRVFPNNPLLLNWDQMDGTFDSYKLFLEACRMLGGDESTTYREWAGGRCLIPIVMGDYMPSLRYSSPQLNGLLNINIGFSGQIPFALNFYALGVSIAQLRITKDGGVIPS